MKKIFLIVAILVISPRVDAQETPLQIEKIGDNLYTYATYKEFKGTLYSSNALYLVTEEGVVLFDTPWDQKLNQPLLDSIQYKHQKNVIKVFATHWHEDRAGGFDFFNRLGIDTYASAKTNQKLSEQNLPIALHEFEDEASFQVGGETFDVVFAGEGHTFDNVVVWFPKQRVLNGGCVIKSSTAQNLGNVEDANLASWPQTIKTIEKRFSDAILVIPGHDDWKQKGHLEHTLKLLEQNK